LDAFIEMDEGYRTGFVIHFKKEGESSANKSSGTTAALIAAFGMQNFR